MFSAIFPSKPSKIEMAIISTATPKAMPAIVITDINDKNLDPLSEVIYRLAIRKGNFMLDFMQNL
jgi:hypothetical protein